MLPHREAKLLLEETSRLMDEHSTITRKSFKAIRQSIRENAKLETTSQGRIDAAHKLLNETSEMVKGYKPTMR